MSPMARFPHMTRALMAAASLVITFLGAPDTTFAQSSPFPQHFRATFTLNASNVDIGVTRWELTPLSNGRSSFSTQSEAIGIAKLFRNERINERSEWQLVDGRIRPLLYTYSRKGGKRDRETRLNFDWARRVALSERNGKRATVKLSNNTLDKSVYLIGLMMDLAKGMRQMQYTVADHGKTSVYQVAVVGDESVQTVVGDLQTVIVERKQAGKSRLTRIWCAKAYHFLPVKLEHIEDDGTVRFTLTQLEGFGLK
jgi:hypothetical protein